MVYLLDDHKVWFPDPRNGDPDGLIAIGGDLSYERLALAYQYGIFPWYGFRDGPIQWWCPMERFVIFPDKIHISHSMRTLLHKKQYTITFNQAFEQVIHECGRLRYDEEGAWLGPDITKAYINLHQHDLAKSVEVWKIDESAEGGCRLVGGLYGVVSRHCFIGESMFSLEPNTSKLALIHLAQRMESNGGLMIDCQLHTKHLESMGGAYIPYEEYIEYLRR